jgi:hypothetical protein
LVFVVVIDFLRYNTVSYLATDWQLLTCYHTIPSLFGNLHTKLPLSSAVNKSVIVSYGQLDVSSVTKGLQWQLISQIQS